jgi:hypothetical protein
MTDEGLVADGKRDIDYWRGHILAWRDSGLKQHDYCVREGLVYTQFSYWRTRINRTDKGGNSRLKFIGLKKSGVDGFAVAERGFQVAFRNGARIIFPGNLDKESLHALIIALGALPC